VLHLLVSMSLSRQWALTTAINACAAVKGALCTKLGYCWLRCQRACWKSWRLFETIVMQRLHQDDLIGHVLERGHWEIPDLPAIAEEDECHVIETIFGSRTLIRKAGQGPPSRV
jgi:hypothetical protein